MLLYRMIGAHVILIEYFTLQEGGKQLNNFSLILILKFYLAV